METLQILSFALVSSPSPNLPEAFPQLSSFHQTFQTLLPPSFDLFKWISRFSVDSYKKNEVVKAVEAIYEFANKNDMHLK